MRKRRNLKMYLMGKPIVGDAPEESNKETKEERKKKKQEKKERNKKYKEYKKQLKKDSKGSWTDDGGGGAFEN